MRISGLQVLTAASPKLVKGEKKGYLSFILYFAPAMMSGVEVCPARSPACTFECLNTAGRGGIFKKGTTSNVIQLARIRKTQWFHNAVDEFMTALARDIRKGIRIATKHELIPCFRLNGTSDIAWESIPCENSRNVFEAFPGVQFYDYTKRLERLYSVLPPNYGLTFSRSEINTLEAYKALQRGFNVAVVFDKLPEEYFGFPVFNGDESDLRFLDPKIRVIGLKAKGRARKDKRGFVVRGATTVSEYFERG